MPSSDSGTGGRGRCGVSVQHGHFGLPRSVPSLGSPVSVVSILGDPRGTRHFLRKLEGAFTYREWPLTVTAWTGHPSPAVPAAGPPGTSLGGSDIAPSARRKMPTSRLGVISAGDTLCYSFVLQNGADKHWVRRGRRKRGPDPTFQELKMAWNQSLLQGLHFSFVMNGIRVLVQAKYCRQCWC